ncbi:MAG: hypothetical protein ACKVHO_10945 [Verrucomicrobiia bacterium]
MGTIATGGSIGGVYWPVAVGVGSKVSGGGYPSHEEEAHRHGDADAGKQGD